MRSRGTAPSLISPATSYRGNNSSDSPTIVKILCNLCALLFLRIRVDFVVDDGAIPADAVVPIGASGPETGRVVQVILLELGAATQVLEESFRATDFTLDDGADSEVGALVQVLVQAVHAAGKSTGKNRVELLGNSLRKRRESCLTHLQVSLTSCEVLGMLFSGNCNVTESRQVASEWLQVSKQEEGKRWRMRELGGK